MAAARLVAGPPAPATPRAHSRTRGTRCASNPCPPALLHLRHTCRPPSPPSPPVPIFPPFHAHLLPAPLRPFPLSPPSQAHLLPAPLRPSTATRESSLTWHVTSTSAFLAALGYWNHTCTQPRRRAAVES